MKEIFDTYIKVQNMMASDIVNDKINFITCDTSRKGLITYRIPFIKKMKKEYKISLFGRSIYFSKVRESSLGRILKPVVFDNNMLYLMVCTPKKENFLNENISIDSVIYKFLKSHLKEGATLINDKDHCRFFIDGKRVSSGNSYIYKDGQICYFIGFKIENKHSRKFEYNIMNALDFKTTTEFRKNLYIVVRDYLITIGLF